VPLAAVCAFSITCSGLGVLRRRAGVQSDIDDQEIFEKE
jgi:hypothetical protein